jgi:GNAT superfamily N-acetyltransferase
MPEIHIRPAEAADIPTLIKLDHNSVTDSVWQMAFHHNRDQSQIDINFRKVRLPRAVRHEYPRPANTLAEDWSRFSGLLVALLSAEPIGYASLVLDHITQATWVTDLVVAKPIRRQGIGSALVLASAEWAATKDSHNLVLEMQPKNGPGIGLALKLGFEFCGYNDFYYPVYGTGIFFRKSF